MSDSFDLDLPSTSSVLSNSEESSFDFDYVSVKIASPEKILSWSYGEVKSADTINYRTFKPERDGLFCARIFGPIKDYECLCGKYRRRKYKGIKCEKCDVEVISSRVRRERMGHINLIYPVVNILYLKTLPSKISILLDISVKDLERIVYFERYLVLDPGNTSLQKLQLLSEEEYAKAMDEFGQDSFRVETGAEAVKLALADINLEEERDLMSGLIAKTKSELKLKTLVRRMQLIERFISSGNRPEWMIIDVLPVMPPELRPLVPLDGGKLAISDLNALYATVIHRNNRLAKLKSIGAPKSILHNECRMLQNAVNALLNNSAGGNRAVKNSLGRPLKSISDFLKGKQGRFRQNLLGKRVDYSGRSVIVVGPELRLHECGLPKRMALELFKPFVLAHLRTYGSIATIKAGIAMIEAEMPEVWEALEKVIAEHPVLLNRAPTLHRLGIQAFEPKLVESKAIKLHPLVCRAFNADFDGDQMAVHVPLSIEAQVEARVLMMSSNNILSPSNGMPVIVPRKDITAGLYYMSLAFENEVGNGKTFYSYNDVVNALDNKVVTVNSKIKYYFKYTDGTLNSIDTTPGRVLLLNLLPQDGKLSLAELNLPWSVSVLNEVVQKVHNAYGSKVTVIFCDKIMNYGFKYSTVSGLSIGKDDITVPDTKSKHIERTMKEIKATEDQYLSGYITQKERFNKVTDLWSMCTSSISSDMMKLVDANSNNKNINSIKIMMSSGARASEAQMRQLAGMRGLIAKPSGGIIETPVISNFKEGLSVMEYFNATHGARKGNVDTALKTADAGYLTRRLVDVSQDCIITEEDCGSHSGVIYKPLIEDGKLIQKLSAFIEGRFLCEDVTLSDGTVFSAGSLVTKEIGVLMDRDGVPAVKVRSPVTCDSEFGICAKCYGVDLATKHVVDVGEPVGIVAAQSIGEPGTQLTLNTFHIGGAASKQIVVSSIEATCAGKVVFSNLNVVKDRHGDNVVISHFGEVAIVDSNGKELTSHPIQHGATLFVVDGGSVKVGDKIASWDPYNAYVISEYSGNVKFEDMVRNVSYAETVDDVTGISSKIVINWSDMSKGLKPALSVVDSKGNSVTDESGINPRYFLSINAVLIASDGDSVLPGDRLAKVPVDGLGIVKDITGGLPRVEEVFEARSPKEPAIIAGADGYVEFGKDSRGKSRMTIHPDDKSLEPITYNIPRDKYICVRDGSRVKKGGIIVHGNLDPHDILQLQGVSALTVHTVYAIQEVYRLQGIEINSKHIEIIVRYMLSKVIVTDSGDTELRPNYQYDLPKVKAVNFAAVKNEGKPASFRHVLYGITKVSVQTESFFSAASFQETMKVLTQAAVEGKTDHLRGMKENIIVGRLIPAGTGFVTQRMKTQARHSFDNVDIA